MKRADCRCLGIFRFFAVALVMLIPFKGYADDPPPNTLTAAELAESWSLLFDGTIASDWHVEGDHRIVDGVLILGGKQETRAYLRHRFPQNAALRFQYRMREIKPAGVGWDEGRGGEIIPGITYRVLPRSTEWRDALVEEYWDIKHPFQRFIKYQNGANGVFGPIESFWIEVPAGQQLHLRNIRWRPGSPVSWAYIIALPLVSAGLVAALAWRIARMRRKQTGNNG